MKKLVIIALQIVTSIGFSQSQSKRVTEFNLEKKIALQGYDPIGYFKQNKAVKGKKEIATTYDGVVYYFSSIENKNVFIKTPTKYEPQFGGWCAYAMGETGEKVEINPETFKIIEGKLYLFYNAYFNNTLKSWNKNETILKSKAEANWKKVIK
jgi:YHS domain-containing protein